MFSQELEKVKELIRTQEGLAPEKEPRRIPCTFLCVRKYWPRHFKPNFVQPGLRNLSWHIYPWIINLIQREGSKNTRGGIRTWKVACKERSSPSLCVAVCKYVHLAFSLGNGKGKGGAGGAHGHEKQAHFLIHMIMVYRNVRCVFILKMYLISSS